jgi:dephospho-CoA kinase
LLKVGLTGGIASGKSVVGGMFAELGAHLVEADQIAHQLMQPGEPVYRKVVREFGSGILNPDGTIHRAKLAQQAFGSPAAGLEPRIEVLNQLVHPGVVERQDQWMAEIGRKDPRAIAMVEAALILEAGAGTRFDRLIVVTCRPEQRIERWAERVHVDYETARREVARRMAAQFSEEEKIRASDFVIDNSGTLEGTRAQVTRLYPRLRSEAEERAAPEPG